MMFRPFDPNRPQDAFAVPSTEMRGYAIICRRRGHDARDVSDADEHLLRTIHVPLDRPMSVASYIQSPPVRYWALAVPLGAPSLRPFMARHPAPPRAQTDPL